MQKRYNIIQAPILAFFSGNLYDDVARRWTGFGFLYLLLLLAVTWLVPVAVFSRVATEFFAGKGALIIEQVPAVTIEGGRVSISEPQPYHITDPDTGKSMIIIDTTGEVTSLDDEADAEWLLTESRLVSRHPVQIHDLSEMHQLHFDKITIKNGIESHKKGFFVLVYLICAVFSFAYRIVQVLVYGWIAVGFGRLFDKPLDYITGVRLAVMAITPVVVIGTVLDGVLGPFRASQLLGSFWWALCLAIAMGYLVFAVRSVAVEVDAPVDSWDIG